MTKTKYSIKKEQFTCSFLKTGAGEESRTLDLNLGKVALYQLSYSRITYTLHATDEITNHSFFTATSKKNFSLIYQKLEREKSLELSTSTLARLRSTN